MTVRLTAYEEAGRLHIKVKDDGEGGGRRGMARSGTGVGLEQCPRAADRPLRRRAGCLHGPDPDGGYTVHLYMPVVRG